MDEDDPILSDALTDALGDPDVLSVEVDCEAKLPREDTVHSAEDQRSRATAPYSAAVRYFL